jgi:hypothetical protein
VKKQHQRKPRSGEHRVSPGRVRTRESLADGAVPRSTIDIPVQGMSSDPDYHPTPDNIAAWRANGVLLRVKGHWKVKSLFLALPVPGKPMGLSKSDPYGGDAAPKMLQAQLDRHVAAVCVFVSKRSNDVALGIEVLDEDIYTLTFYVVGPNDSWQQAAVPREISDAFVPIRALYEAMIEPGRELISRGLR